MTPLRIEGIRNGFIVESGKLYRGGQPKDEAFKYLAWIGVGVVLDLCQDGEHDGHSTTREAGLVSVAGMDYVSVPVKDPGPPSQEILQQILLNLRLLKKPVFVHCWLGVDRTGCVCACYRLCQGMKIPEIQLEAAVCGAPATREWWTAVKEFSKFLVSQ